MENSGGFHSSRVHQHSSDQMKIINEQHARTTTRAVSECYISLKASIFDRQNVQFNNVKKGNFRSLKDCDKQRYNYDD